MGWRAPAFSAAAAAILTLSCVAQAPVSPAAVTPAEAERPRPGGRIVRGALGDIATLQPILVNDSASGSVTALLYAGLIRPAPDNGEPTPNMATFSQSAVAHHVPVQWAYPDPKTLNQYAYDKAKAESLLQEAGYAKGADGIYAKDGKPISFTIRTNAGNKVRETLAQVAAEQYKAIGIDAKTRLEGLQGLVTQLTEGHPSVEAVIIGWALGPEPDPYIIWHSSQIPDPATKRTGFGFTAFKNAEMDRALEQGRNPTDGDCSVAARKKHYEVVNKILNEEQPYNFGFSTIAISVTAADIQSVQPRAFGGFTHNVHEWWFRGTK